MSKKNAKDFVIKIHCAGCRTFLYRYRKEGAGKLIKCYVSNILEDGTAGDLKCPNCNQPFAREAIIHNRPAHKIIQGKVIVIGHCGK
jgi:hypothetical protein